MLPISGSAGTGVNSNALTQNSALLSQILPGGISVQALVNELQASQASLTAPLNQIAMEMSTLSNQSQGWSQVLSAIGTVSTDATALSTTSDLSPTGAPVSSDATVVSATGSGASAGTYAVSVTQLAQDQVTNSNTVSTGFGTALGYSGTLTIGFGGKTATVAVKASDSLSTIAQNLNTASASLSGLDMSATVLPASGGGSVLSLSAPTGASSFTVTASGSNLPLSFTNSQTSQAAQYSVNGVANSSNTNSVQNALGTGVTLNLLATTATPVNLTVSQNDQQVSSAVSKLVQDVQSLASTLTSVAGRGGPLEGNAALLGLSETLVNTLTGLNQSLPAGYQSLADMGLSVSWSTSQGQRVTFDQGTFTNAISANPSAVASLFTGTGGIAAQISNYLTSYTDPATGIIQSAQNAISSEENTLTIQQTNDEAMIQQQMQAQDNQFTQELQSMLQQSSMSQALTASFGAMSGNSTSGSNSKPGG